MMDPVRPSSSPFASILPDGHLSHPPTQHSRESEVGVVVKQETQPAVVC